MLAGFAAFFVGIVRADIIYEPSADTVSGISMQQARQTFQLLAAQGEFARFDGRYNPVPIDEVTLMPGSLRAAVRGSGAGLDIHCSLLFRDIGRISVYDVDQRQYPDWPPYFVNLLGPALPDPCKQSFHFHHLEDAKGFANAVYVLAHTSPTDLAGQDKGSSAAFDEVARHYRSRAEKPELPEDARRYKIQAASAIKEKRYEDAIALYEKALGIAPWWPEGHFNRALLLGDQQDYEDAITEMKKYLALEPKAPNARAAQDKIYEWEGNEK